MNLFLTPDEKKFVRLIQDDDRKVCLEELYKTNGLIPLYIIQFVDAHNLKCFNSLIKVALKQDNVKVDNKMLATICISNHCKIKYKKFFGMGKENDNCSICLKNFKFLDKIVYLQCKHFYHSQCLENWFCNVKTATYWSHYKCPTCIQQCCTCMIKT
jgi:hypothetical protein